MSEPPSPLPPASAAPQLPKKVVTDGRDTLVAWVASKMGILAVPAIGYFCAFLYQRAYCYAFGIPVTFIQIDLTQVLIFSAALLGVWYFLFLILSTFVELGDHEEGSKSARRTYYFALVITWTGLRWGLDLPLSSSYLIYIEILFGIGVLTDILGTVLNRRMVAGIPPIRRPWDLYPKLRRKFGDNFIPIILFFGGIFFSSALGTHSAISQTRFQVPRGNPNLALVMVAEGKAICAVFDPATKECSGGFCVLELQDDKGVYFDNKDIGPLRLH